MNKLNGLQVRWNSWWESRAIEKLAIKHDLIPNHANWLEAFNFNMVCELPADKKNPPGSTGLMGAAETKQIYQDGSFGGYYHVDEKIMHEIFQAALLDILFQLQFD